MDAWRYIRYNRNGVFSPVFRKLIGPLLIVTGLVLIGLLPFGLFQRVKIRIPMKLKNGKIGSFLLGASFALAFSPTMFVLFFVWLMPLVVTTSYGLLLPAVFGVATSLPLLILLLLLWFFDAKKRILRTSRKVGKWVQRMAGMLLILIGIADTLTYWSL
ncbi:cytochrome c biogenesis protein CcdA [Sporosarcina sp. Te-1]|uniref:urease accessory protein UreH domain-containing protein n=1 Tax=Sporosarcina sp. Te-1 TaxID=2818390 RepID=UPI0035301B0B